MKSTTHKGLDLGGISFFVLLYGVLEIVYGVGHLLETGNQFVWAFIISGAFALVGSLLDFTNRGGLGLVFWGLAIVPVVFLVVLGALFGFLYIPLIDEGSHVLKTFLDWCSFIGSGMFYVLVIGFVLGLFKLRKRLKDS